MAMMGLVAIYFMNYRLFSDLWEVEDLYSLIYNNDSDNGSLDFATAKIF